MIRTGRLMAAAVFIGLVVWMSATGRPLVVVVSAAALVVVIGVRASDPGLLFACVGLVVLSWDRVSVEIGPMTLKPTYVAFALAFIAEVVSMSHDRFRRPSPVPPSSHDLRATIRAAVAVLLGLYVLATLASGFPLDGGRQIFVIVVGAVIPAWVMYRIGRFPSRRRTAIIWALIGVVLTTAIGLYQFAAVSLHLPTVFPYQGTAQGLGRTAAFAYEPATFAMYLLIFMPLAVGLVLERGRVPGAATRLRVPLFLVVLFGVLLSNSRAGYLVLVAAVLLPAVTARSGGRARLAGALATALVVVTALSLVTRFDAFGFARARLESIGDTTEKASNAPRLRLYGVEREIAADHPLLGIGPGTLGRSLPDYGFPLRDYQHEGPPGSAAPLRRVVANNIWLQAVLDGGLGGFVALLCLLWGLFQLARRCSDPYGRRIALGCLLVLLVGGFLTSNLWDVKIWALIGLALGADRGTGSGPMDAQLRTSDCGSSPGEDAVAPGGSTGGPRVRPRQRRALSGTAL